MKFSDMFAWHLLSPILLLLITGSNSEEVLECPPATEIEPCKCYSSLNTMICNDLTRPFELTKAYHIVKLEIRNSHSLSLLTEHIRNESMYLKVDNLVILHDASSTSKLVSLDHLENVLGVTTKSVHIVSRRDIPNQILDVSDLSEQLTSLTISNVSALNGFEFAKFASLKRLQLIDVHLHEEITNVDLLGTQLTHVELINVDNLKGKFVFSPNQCSDNDKIHINLRHTKGLEDFSFAELFATPKCHYHIDLSGVQNFRRDLLTSQVEILDKKLNGGSFYLVFVGVTNLQCDCLLYDLYRKLAEFIHSLQCSNLEHKFLDQIEPQHCSTSTTTAKPTTLPTIKTENKVRACPADDEIGQSDPTTCKCNSSDLSMICTSLTGIFKLKKHYHLNSLEFKSIQNLSLFTEHTSEKASLTVDNLIITQNAQSPEKTMDNLESVLAVATKSIKIVLLKQNVVDQHLVVASLSKELTSISINGVGSLEGFDFNNFIKLENLQLHDVKFIRPPITNVALLDSSLTRVQITSTHNLDGYFTFSPKECKANQTIHIDLRDTKGLMNFDFSQLFKTENCQYNIDLSGTSMTSNLFTSQVAILDKQKPGSFELILADVPKLECDCKLYKLYHKFEQNYIHSVHCEKQGEYLDLITEKEACP